MVDINESVIIEDPLTFASLHFITSFFHLFHFDFGGAIRNIVSKQQFSDFGKFAPMPMSPSPLSYPNFSLIKKGN